MSLGSQNIVPVYRLSGLPDNYCWGVLYLSFVEAFQDREDTHKKDILDVSVLMSDDFQIAKTIKVVAEHELTERMPVSSRGTMKLGLFLQARESP